MFKIPLCSFSMIPYGCLSTGSNVGMIEVVYQAETLAKLQRRRGGVTAAFSRDSIWVWLQEYHATEERLAQPHFLHYHRVLSSFRKYAGFLRESSWYGLPTAFSLRAQGSNFCSFSLFLAWAFVAASLMLLSSQETGWNDLTPPPLFPRNIRIRRQAFVRTNSLTEK